MVPETCEPTCTVITALMVPVASTTSRMSPRLTLAVKYSVLLDGRNIHQPMMAIITTAATAPSHVLVLRVNVTVFFDSPY